MDRDVAVDNSLGRRSRDLDVANYPGVAGHRAGACLDWSW
jgi:hypothetical protein